MGLVAPAMFDQLAPPLVLTCHWAVGVGDPVAVVEKKITFPDSTVVVDGGLSVIAGGLEPAGTTLMA